MAALDDRTRQVDEDMIDLTKTYTTRDGREVLLHDIILFNSTGFAVTFPVKGSIITHTPTGRLRTKYAIWRIDGRFTVTGEAPEDLIEINY